MLEQLCAPNSRMLPHFVDLFDLQACSDSAAGKAPACETPGRQWYLERVATGTPPPPPRPDEKEMNAQYQRALGEAGVQSTTQLHARAESMLDDAERGPS